MDAALRVLPRGFVANVGQWETVEKVFAVAPGADPGRIVVRLGGVEAVRVSEEGALVVGTGYGEVEFS
ncbi:MAG: hypothetical protein RMI39_06985, partial [Thermoanaerobaculum sp.]|nr:hypothetical protein [Thermoanaerobaculum sp.]